MRVAILGAGPAGSALAILLTRLGAEVTLFDDGRRPELLVGESLIPAVVPILQRLGVEVEAAVSGPVKPGVSFVWTPRAFETGVARRQGEKVSRPRAASSTRAVSGTRALSEGERLARRRQHASEVGDVALLARESRKRHVP